MKKVTKTAKATKKTTRKAALKKVKTTTAGLISMNILVDSSGSMKPIASDMAGSLNQLVDEHRDLNVTVTYSIFANTYQPVFADKPIKKVKEFILKADGSTALIESACKMIDEVGERLAAMPESERPGKVMFVIITDGQENASAPGYTRERLFTKIREQTEVYNWLFLYLGANQDAIREAARYGISADKAVDWHATARGTQRSSERLSKKLRQAAASDASHFQDIAFDEEDRKE